MQRTHDGWWVRPDLNQRPRHLQCRALPTKLLTRARLANALAISSLPMRSLLISSSGAGGLELLNAVEGFLLKGEQRIKARIRPSEQGRQFFSGEG